MERACMQQQHAKCIILQRYCLPFDHNHLGLYPCPCPMYHTLMGSYFSPIAPPFCFWNWIYRNVLAKKASADGSDVVLSLCISVVINSTRSLIALLVIWGFPFSKKYKYLKITIISVHGPIYQPKDGNDKSSVSFQFTCSVSQQIGWQDHCYPASHWPSVVQHLQSVALALGKAGP